MRYEITDKVDDLRGQRTKPEIVAIGAALYAPLADFILRSRRAWSGAGKWVPRSIAEVDPLIGPAFAAAFDDLFCQQNPSALIQLAQDELSRHGGFFFNGYRREAPTEWRMEGPKN